MHNNEISIDAIIRERIQKRWVSKKKVQRTREPRFDVIARVM